MTRAFRWLADPLTFGGVAIRVAAHVDDLELSRRERFQPLEPVSREALEALFVLPDDAFVPERSMPAWAARALRSAPEWVAERYADGWKRTYRSPAQVVGIGLADWSPGIEEQLAALEWLSPIGPRVVVVSSMDRALEGIDVVTARAAGLAIAESTGEYWMLVSPSASRVRLTPQRWWLAEMVADLKCSVGEPPATPWLSDRG